VALFLHPFVTRRRWLFNNGKAVTEPSFIINFSIVFGCAWWTVMAPLGTPSSARRSSFGHEVSCPASEAGGACCSKLYLCFAQIEQVQAARLTSLPSAAGA
jgi:hypothetical protein